MGDIEYTDQSGDSVKEFFTFDPVREEENKINAKHAELIFNIKFIPFYPKLLKRGLSFNAILLYGWIDFFTGGEKFFCVTDHQISELFGYSEQTAQRTVKELKDHKLIEFTHKTTFEKGKLRKIRIKNEESSPVTSEGSNLDTHEGSTIVYKTFNTSRTHPPLKNEGAGGAVPSEKERQGEFVWLTPVEHSKLVAELGFNGAKSYVDRLDSYIGQIGEPAARKKYKSHYHTILNWVRGDKANGKFKTEKEIMEDDLRRLGNQKFVAKYGRDAWENTHI